MHVLKYARREMRLVTTVDVGLKNVEKSQREAQVVSK